MIGVVGRRAMLAVALSGFAGAVAAQTGPRGPGGGPGAGYGPGGGGPGRMGHGMMNGSGMMGGGWDLAGYLDSLKAELAITPAQEPAWKAYAEVVDGVAQQMQGVHQTMYEAMGTATWQERRDMMNTMFEAREHAFDTVQAAAQALLPTLDAAQKARAQTSLPGLARGRRMMRR